MSEFDKEVEKLKQSIYQSLGVPAEYLKSSPEGIRTSFWIQEDIGGVFLYKCANCLKETAFPMNVCKECGRHMVMVIDERFAYILRDEFEFEVKENKEIYGQVSMFD